MIVFVTGTWDVQVKRTTKDINNKQINRRVEIISFFSSYPLSPFSNGSDERKRFRFRRACFAFSIMFLIRVCRSMLKQNENCRIDVSYRELIRPDVFTLFFCYFLSNLMPLINNRNLQNSFMQCVIYVNQSEYRIGTKNVSKTKLSFRIVTTNHTLSNYSTMITK